MSTGLRRVAPFLPVLGCPLVLAGGSVSYLVRILTALLAVLLLWRTSPEDLPGLRRTRQLLGGVLLIGIASGVLSEAHLLLTGASPPPGWYDDWVYLAYTPVALAAVLTVPRTDEGRGSAARILADGAIASASLAALVVGVWGSGVGEAGRSAQVIAVLGPVFPVFVVAAVLSVLPRCSRTGQPFLRWAGAALTVLAASDLAYTARMLGASPDVGGWSPVLSQLGVALVVPAVLACRRSGPELPPTGSGGLLLSVAPFLPAVPAVAVTTVHVLRGGRIGSAQAGALLLLTLAVLVRHVLGTVEQQRMIDTLRVSEAGAERRSRTDALTGLGNRRALHEALAAVPPAQQVVLALLDLDDFKDLNDSQGHEAGDEVLRMVADRLRDAVPAGATVVRLGGDEFAVVVPGGSQTGLADLLVGALREPLVLRELRTTARASIGIVSSDWAGDEQLLLAHADAAMYEAKADKAQRLSRAVLLQDEGRDRVLRRLRVRDLVAEPDLRQFTMLYQPVVELATLRVVGAEALLRWTHPELGPVPATTFIPLAEQVGSIQTLGAFALEQALSDLASARRAWAERTGSELDVNIAVNLSPRQLDSGLVAAVRRALDVHGVPESRLVLEITEEALLDDRDGALDAVEGLRALGVLTAVDDFGTGWSSLRYLRRFAPDIVKMDGEFIAEITTDVRTGRLVGSVVHLAEQLGLDCVAEGIETLEQLDALRASGCRFGQGFLLGRPMPVDQLMGVVQTGAVPVASQVRRPTPLPLAPCPDLADPAPRMTPSAT